MITARVNISVICDDSCSFYGRFLFKAPLLTSQMSLFALRNVLFLITTCTSKCYRFAPSLIFQMSLFALRNILFLITTSTGKCYRLAPLLIFYMRMKYVSKISTNYISIFNPVSTTNFIRTGASRRHY